MTADAADAADVGEAPVPERLDVLDDLTGEGDDLAQVLAPLAPDAWEHPTAVAGWAVHHHITHLRLSDTAGVLAATRPDDFAGDAKALLARISRPATDTPEEAFAEWDAGRTALLDALGSLAHDARLPWFGPPMGIRSFATARLMETWTHGHDIATALAGDGLAVVPAPTDRLRHICHLGVITRDWSFTVRDLAPPTSGVAVVLTLPSGATWTGGDDHATDRVTGSAHDFCLVVTQRRNVADTGLQVEGADAARWMSIAQCFAGRATLPPAPAGSA